MKPTVEQLLAMLEKGKEKKRRIENNKNVLRYLEEMKVESGTLLVPNYIIFWHYRNKWKCDRHFKANKIVFFRTLLYILFSSAERVVNDSKRMGRHFGSRSALLFNLKRLQYDATSVSVSSKHEL